MNNYIIYVHQNKINGKLYIGQTKQKPQERWRNGEGYFNSTYFYHAIKKYGWSNFNHIILIENLSLQEANEIEKFLINKYNTKNHNFGYNLTDGGDGQLGRIPSEETKEKIRQEHLKANRIGFNSYKGKPVVCLETQEIFGSARQAAFQINLNEDAVAKCCRGEKLTAGGKHWMYQSEYTEEKAQQILNTKPKTPLTTKVRCKETGDVFNSLQEAANWAGLKTKCNISSCCTGNRKTAGKIPGTNTPCSWEYYNLAVSEKQEEDAKG